MDAQSPPAPLSESRVRCTIDVTAAAWLLRASDLDGARRLLASALAAAPHDVGARALLGQVLFRQRDFIAASEVFERLIAEFPDDVPLLFNLALCHLKSGRPGPAAATLRHILEVRPDHSRARGWLRVAEAATPGPPAVFPFGSASPSEPPQPSRTSTRPARLEEVPRVSLPPGALLAKDESGVVSLRVDDEAQWVVRRSTLEGYSGDVAQAQAPHGLGFLALSGGGTALLRAPGSLVVLELRGEETGVRASALAAYAMPLASEIADPNVVGDFGESIVRLSGTGPVVLEARAELTALPVSLTHATTVRWDHVVGWTGNVIGAPSSQVDAEGRTLARFAGSGSLLLAMSDAVTTSALASYGRHEVIRRLGGGPRDEILLARSAGPGGYSRKVVLERRLVVGGDARSVERLAQEAHAYALLTHPAIARLFDFLLIDGHPVIVREYVSGVSLAELVTAAGDRDAEARSAMALYVAHGVLSGLAAAHDACDPDTGDVVSLVHGDVRSGCVLIGWNGDVKLMGFAAARLEGDRPPTMTSDVRAATRLLLDLLGPRATDPTSEASLEDALARVRFEAVRSDRRASIRTALLASLVAPPAGAPRARELADGIAESVDLALARTLTLEVLGALRQRLGGAALSSFPPPVVTVEEREDEDDADRDARRYDSRFFHRQTLPRPSPVPVIAGEPARLELRVLPSSAPPALFTRESYVTPPPVQPPSLDPAASLRPSAPHLMGSKGQRLATAIAVCVVALASGIASLGGARPGGESAGASSPPPPAAPATSSVPEPPAALPARVPSPPPPPVSSPPATGETEVTGALRAPARAKQHRIFLDGRAIGEGPGDYVVRCGAHDVRIGSHGSEKRVDVPCGGSVDLD